MEDLKHMKKSYIDILIEAACDTAEKYDSDKRAQKKGKKIKKNPLRFCIKKQQKKKNPVRFCIKKQKNYKKKNLTSYFIRNSTRTAHKKLTKGGTKKVKNSVINKSSRKANKVKEEIKLTMSNEEWIKAMEMKRENQRNRMLGSQNPPPPLPSLAEEFETMILNEYGGTEIMRVIQKPLYVTDKSKSHARLSIPCSQVESFKFLNDEEMTQLRLGHAITVPLIHKPSENGVALPLREMSMEFAQWNVHKDKKDPLKVSYQYVLRKKWNALLKSDELEKENTIYIIQIWAFRNSHNKLCMALVKL